MDNENKTTSNEEVAKAVIDQFEKTMNAMSAGNSKAAFLCPCCSHKAVCKEIETPSEKCEHFADATTYQRYPSIYHFFQPIFDWINFHYPTHDVKFIVDHNSARMMLEHGPCAFSKEINNAVNMATKTTEDGGNTK